MPCFTYWASIHCREWEPPGLRGFSFCTVGQRVQHVNNTAKVTGTIAWWVGRDHDPGQAGWSFPAQLKGHSLSYWSDRNHSCGQFSKQANAAAACTGRAVHVWTPLSGGACSLLLLLLQWSWELACSALPLCSEGELHAWSLTCCHACTTHFSHWLGPVLSCPILLIWGTATCKTEHEN